MTALTLQARPEQDARRPPLPWRRMAWVTWRQHRTTLGRGGRVPRRAGGVLVAHRPSDTPRRTRPSATRQAHSPATMNFTGRYGITAIIVSILLQAVPALIGAFAGAPVLAREMETGTFRFAWTQGFGRWRWALAKLVLLAVAVAAAAGAFSVLFSWYNQPFSAAGYAIPFATRRVRPGRGRVRRLDAGRLRDRCPGRDAHPAGRPRDRRHPGRLRRARPRDRAVAAPALHDTAAHQQTEPARFRVDRQPVVHQGRQVRVRRPGLPDSQRRSQHCSRRWSSNLSPAQCLSQHGYTMWSSYQPGSRFWPFQWIEGGWLLALSVLLIAATVWLVRRRAA